MLRSIFSLIQRIIDCPDKKYNNTKPQTLLYRFTIPVEYSADMNPNTRSQQTVHVSPSVQQKEAQQIEAAAAQQNRFKIETEHGDVGTCKHDKDELNRVTFTNAKERTLNEIGSEVDLEVQPSIRELIGSRPTKHVEISSTGPDQMSLLLEQIQKMKIGLERLQEIALQFNCSKRFSEDINYLIENIGPHLQQQSSSSDDSSNDISSKI